MEYIIKITTHYNDKTVVGYYERTTANKILLSEDSYHAQKFEEIVVARAMLCRYYKMRGHLQNEKVEIVPLKTKTQSEEYAYALSL